MGAAIGQQALELTTSCLPAWVRAQVAGAVGSAGAKLTDGLLAVVPGGDALRRQRQGYSPGLSYDPTADMPHGAPDFIAMWVAGGVTWCCITHRAQTPSGLPTISPSADPALLIPEQ